ncbi:MAG: major facilitator superfamily 1 [Thermoleophilia bacterium]|nr:major facilitator superfamily 1 [Thermoleophilia bacterium]
MDAAPERFRLFTAPRVSWALYDFANTMFAFAIVSRYFNDWVIDQHGRPDWNVGLMSAIVGLLLVVAMPAVGALSDQVGRRLPFLATFTIGCVLATMSIRLTDDIPLALVICGFAIFCYQLALSMYDPLLATVAPRDKFGAVSGLGVGTGYLGTLAVIGALTPIVRDGHLEDAFIPTALLFGVFAIPIFVFVKERPPVRAPRERGAVRRALRQVAVTIGHIRTDDRAVGRFLLARFLYFDAIATVIAFMSVYMTRLGGFSEGTKTLILGFATIFAVLGAYVSGALVQRLGPKRVLTGILLLTTTTLTLAAATGSAGLIWVLAPSIGIALGGVATSDRVFMMRLTNPEVRGEFFGIYNLIGKLSSGFGPLVLWSGTIWILHTHGSLELLGASRAALGVLAVAVIAGLYLLWPLDDTERYPEASDVAPVVEA